MRLKSFASGSWHESSSGGRDVFNAISGEKIAEISSEGLNFKEMLEYARTVGNPKLREMTFHALMALPP